MTQEIGARESASGIPVKVNCIKCQIAKPKTEFYAGQGRTCKECVKKANRRNRAANPLRYKATRKEWEKGNITRAQQRKKARLRKRYKLTHEVMHDMLKAQGQQCLICEVPLYCPVCDLWKTDDSTKAVVDHDHNDGHIRGLLCSACNTGLGQFEDSLELLKQAYRYLKRDQAQLSAFRT